MPKKISLEYIVQNEYIHYTKSEEWDILIVRMSFSDFCTYILIGISWELLNMH